MRYRIGPCASASFRISTAFVGSCGVSITTTPSEVVTKLGLEPRSFVFVKTFGVTFSMSMSGDLRGLLGGGQAPVDAEDLARDERGGVRAEEDRRAGQVARRADASQRDAADDTGLEGRVVEEHRDLRRVDEGRRD